MLVRIYPENPNPKEIQRVAEILRQGGIIIYPTDTIYGMGCDIFNQKAIEKIASLKGMKAEKTSFSMICYDLSHLADYCTPLNNHIFKLMKRNLPGPFTFILEANNSVPKLLKNKRKTVGIRVPDNNIIRDIVKELGRPILSTSVKDEDELLEYATDPELMHEQFENQIDIVIDGGYGGLVPSTIVDCSNGEIQISRQGLGELE
jgi:tRNA threonylcarbamoyl adenosine modification protein (Sua5/YciO/YrdC/YwlC family)